MSNIHTRITTNYDFSKYSFMLWFLLGLTLISSAAAVAATKEGGTGGGGRVMVHPNIDVNYYMSNRRVPKGADPIHNRRASNSRRPPGKA